MELDELMGLHSDEDASCNLGEASHWGRHREWWRQTKWSWCSWSHPQRGITSPEIIIHSIPYMTGRATTRGVFKRMRFFTVRNTTTWGVFKAYAFFLLYVFVLDHHKCMVIDRSGPLCQSLHEMESCPVSYDQSAAPSVPLSVTNVFHDAQGFWGARGFWDQISSVWAVIWQSRGREQ